MKRIVLPELEDSPAFPHFLRDALTSYLQTVIEAMRPYDVVLPIVQEILLDSGRHGVVDLASGGGGPWATMTDDLRQTFPDLQVELTDAFPNLQAARRLDAEAGLQYRTTPVDALAGPLEDADLLTCFTALHHFDPPQVQSLLERAQTQGIPIVIAEATHRSIRGVLLTLFIPVLVWVMTPRVRPFRPLAVLLTYLPPLVTLMIWWDGLASTLKSYSRRELQRMVDQIRQPGYRWEVLELAVPKAPIPVLCIAGRPERQTST